MEETARRVIERRSVELLLAYMQRLDARRRHTLELNVSMNQTHTMHPPDCLAQLSENPAQQRFGDLGMTLGVVDQVEELASANMFKDETVMRMGAERVDVGHDRWVGYMLYQQ